MSPAERGPERGIVVVGAGECGVAAAFALREAGYEGPLTLVGDEPHLPYERPPLSKSAEEGAAAPALKPIRAEAAFRERAIRRLAGRAAIAVDRAARTVRLSDGESLAYDRLLLATGARARRLPMAAGLSRAHALRTFDDALALGGRLRPGGAVAVIGGGFIGLEFSALARRRGVQVTLVEAAPRLLARAVPPEIGEAVRALHAAEGFDALLVGIGAEPATELAQAAGLAVENGIRVDARLRTSDPAIFAAGDCCAFPLAPSGRHVRLESWRNAQEQGALAARTMLGADSTHAAVPWFWSDQYDHSLQVAGLPEPGCRSVRRDLGDGAFLLFQLGGDGVLQGVAGFGPGNSVAREVRLGEMMIARRLAPDAAALAAPDTRLKSLLAA